MEVRIAALEMLVVQLVATSMNAHPVEWALFEDTFDGAGLRAVDEAPRIGLADPLNAAAAGDVLSILHVARKQSDVLAAHNAAR